ncbi:MAG: hypothetical protein E7269_01985 [Lachnospiraceae bacterium]|nr:hypothetical protein [Lachnospiraceae bacterium]
MNKKRLISRILAVIFMIVFACSATAAFQPKTEAKIVNTAKTGVVDIVVKEFMLSEAGEYELFPGMVSVLPGQNVSKIPVITNQGMDCYLRVALEISAESGYEHLTPITLNEISGIDLSKWIYCDGYFYYTEILKGQESIKFFDTVHIPPEWDNAYVLSKFDISITAEAIQAENFTPDYEAKKPWGDTLIQKAVKVENKNRNLLVEPDLNVHFLNDSKRLFISESDFFDGFATLMPGDVIARTVTLTSDAKEAEIFFKTAPDRATADLDILERIGLTIHSNGMTLYEGNLAAFGTENYVSLGIVGKDNDGSFVFEVSVPPELDNAYAVSELSVEWWFGATWEENTKIPSVSTNDVDVNQYIAFMAISVLGIMIFLNMGKKKEEINENKTS